MRNTVGSNTQLKMVKWKLDNFGYIKSYSGIQNNNVQIKRLKNQLELSASLSEINAMNIIDEWEKKDKMKSWYKKMANKPFYSIYGQTGRCFKDYKEEYMCTTKFCI